MRFANAVRDVLGFEPLDVRSTVRREPAEDLSHVRPEVPWDDPCSTGWCSRPRGRRWSSG